MENGPSARGRRISNSTPRSPRREIIERGVQALHIGPRQHFSTREFIASSMERALKSLQSDKSACRYGRCRSGQTQPTSCIVHHLFHSDLKCCGFGPQSFSKTANPAPAIRSSRPFRMTARKKVSSRNRSADSRRVLSFRRGFGLDAGSIPPAAPPSFSQLSIAASSLRSRSREMEAVRSVRSRAAPRASPCRSTLVCKSRSRNDEDGEFIEMDMLLSSPNGSTDLSQSRHVWKIRAGIRQYTT